ncbi:MAG TPA: ABC transporter permease [Firmicutes bacterium]|nr:ABC transporter permease [Bacillota bacterium]
MKRVMKTLGQIKQYPSAIFGLAIILILIGVSIFALIHIPYSEAIRLWKGADNIWLENPHNASPAWVNILPGVNLPETIIVDSAKNPELKVVTPLSAETTMVDMELTFEYTYDDFPKEINVIFTGKYDRVSPHVEMTWHTPDGRTIPFDSQTLKSTTVYRVSQSARVQRRLGGARPHVGLLKDPKLEESTPLHGEYKLVIEGLIFEEDADFEAKLVLYGQVHGLAGTDHLRRDLSVALLWGTPVALTFSLVAAVGTTMFGLLFAAIGVWYGGWIDGIVQRLTELTMILPTLPIYIMVGLFISRSIWIILLTVIILSLFSGSKVYRAMFLQIKESHYIEAARAYGASDFRIIVRYLIPRIIPTLIPGFVTAIPLFVFLEASLAILGVGDPILPTWGKVLSEAQANGALHLGHYYWVLEPAALLLVTGLAFAIFGFALDRIFNPRLRGL